MNAETMDLMWRFAEKIAPAKYLPEYMRGDTATVFYALATGEDLGLNWTHAMRSTFPSRSGSIGMKGDIILALLQTKGFKVDFAYTDKPVGCTCTITRPEGGTPVSRTFTMDDAQLIETRWRPEEERWERLAENYFYRNFSAEMCQWRSLAKCARVAAADVVGGLYLPEELTEVTEPGSNGNAKSAAAPAETAAEQFVVAEKPEPEQASESGTTVAASNEGEKQEVPPAATETSAAAADAPGNLEIWALMPDSQPSLVVGEPRHSKMATAVDRAITLANERNLTTVVVYTAGGVRKEQSRHRPGETYYEIHAMGDDGKPQFTDEIPATDPKAAGARAVAMATATGRKHLVVRRKPTGERSDFEHCEPPTAKAATPAPADPFDALIAELCGKVGGEAKDARKVLTRYLAAYLGVPARGMPKDRTKLAPPLQQLAAVIDQRLADLKADPEALGTELGGHAKPPLDAFFDKLNWPAALRELAKRVMEGAKQSPEQFIAWAGHPMVGNVAIASLDAVGADIFLRLFLLVKGRAWEVIEFAVSRNIDITNTLTALVGESQKPITEWTAEFATRVLDAIANADPQPRQASLGDAPAPPDDTEWSNGGLPFGD